MSCKLYANIGLYHENDYNTLEERIISAAQCNADAVVLNKSTPRLVIPPEKQYVAFDSKWGTMPYVDAANKSEISTENIEKVSELTEKIGIPVIWSTTDSVAAETINEHTNCNTIKIHKDAVDIYELSRYCKEAFGHVIYNTEHYEEIKVLYGNGAKRKQYSIYYTTDSFPPTAEEINFSEMKTFINAGVKTGYEGREAGIFPCLALGYYGVDYIEKYIGNENTGHESILTPAQFYDLFNSLQIMTDSL